MAPARALKVETASQQVVVYADRLEEARKRIEQRFLDGGGVLLSVLDILNRMVTSLDGLTGSLDEGVASETTNELRATIAALSGLNGAEASRQSGFQEIAESERKLRPHLLQMQETLRYLRTFAVTAKITGAGIPDFAGFAEEILERIQQGSVQVNGLADKLATLGSGLGPIMTKGNATVERYGQVIPQIVNNLDGGVDQIRHHRQQLNERAEQVKTIARGIQMKLASTLSAMQIGDITRQRVEHCQSSFTVLEEFLSSSEADFLGNDERQRLRAVIRHLVSSQMNEIRDDFHRETSKIIDTISSFRDELGQITAIQQEMAGGNDEGGGSLRDLEQGIEQARRAVIEIEAVASEASLMTQTMLVTIESLLADIGVVRIIRGDIHYMALNTNLRCGKLGEEGKAINVVTAELRSFAGHLDEAAEHILAQLKVLESAAKRLVSDAPEGFERQSLDERLARALHRIQATSSSMDAELERLTQEGRSGVSDMNSAMQRLDFRADLGDILERCAQDLASHETADPSGLGPAIEIVGPRINKLYTMASERELHAAVLGTAPPEEAPLTVLSDDDLDAALF